MPSSTGTHSLRLMFRGLFLWFPKSEIVSGTWVRCCLSGSHGKTSCMMKRHWSAPRLPLKPSAFVKRGFMIATGGWENHLALKYSIDVRGEDNAPWAIGYPHHGWSPPRDSWIRRR